MTLTRFDFYDTNDRLHRVEAPVSADEMRALLVVFRTHCKVVNGSYQYDHFKNWLKKYHDIDMFDTSSEVSRVDM